MTTQAVHRPTRIYEPEQFEIDDAPDELKHWATMVVLLGGEFLHPLIIDAIVALRTRMEAAAPTPGDFVRSAQYIADEFRHLYIYDGLLRELGCEPDKIHIDPDMISGEGVSAFTKLHKWSHIAMFNTIGDRAVGLLLEDAVNSSLAPLARTNRSVVIDESGHAQMGYHHLRDVYATDAGLAEAQEGLDLVWPHVMDMFDVVPDTVGAEFIRLGLREHFGSELRITHITNVTPLREGLGLRVPTNTN